MCVTIPVGLGAQLVATTLKSYTRQQHLTRNATFNPPQEEEDEEEESIPM